MQADNAPSRWGIRWRERWRRHATRLRPAAFVVAAVLTLVWASGAIGLGDAVDATARRVFYDLRGPRPSSPSVIFIAIDQDTAREWGAAPWPWERYEELVGHVLAGDPRLIAILEPGPRVLPETEAAPASLAAAVADGRLLMPPPTPGFGQPEVALDTRGVVEAIELGSPSAIAGPTITAEVVRRTGHRPTAGRLAVNYIGPPDALPTLPAHHVARGEIPASTFTGRVVVIGLRGERFTASVPTPVGPMSPAEVHAHALHGLVERVTWRRPPAAVELALVLLCAAASVIGLRRARSPVRATVLLAGAGLLVAAVAYLLFTRWSIALGLGAPLAALSFGALGGLLLERHDAQRDVAELRRTVARRIGAGSRDADLAAPHDRFVDALRSYFDLESCVWAELPAGRWHLNLVGWWGASPDQVHEMRRDVRRDPWRLPYSSHRPEWANRSFLKDELGTRSLVVPLVTFGRLHGFWILNVQKDRVVTEAQIRLLGAITNQLALERERRLVRPEDADDALGSTLVDALHAVHNESLRLGQIHDRHLAVLDHLPVGVLVATLWGHVEYGNVAMRRFLSAAGLDAPEDLGLADLLLRLTGVEAAAVRDVVREVVGGGAAVRLAARTADPVAPRTFELVLARVRFPQEPGEPDEHAPTSLVLTATARAERDLAALDWRWAAAAEGSRARHVVDVAALAREAASRAAASVEIRAASAVVVADGDELGAAIRAVLDEAIAGAPDGARLVVDDDHEVVIVRVIVPATLPAADVAAVRTASAADAPAHLADLIRARDRVAAGRGRLEIESSLEGGTSLALRLPKPGHG